ncbi:calcium homeostasis modulator protein 6-like [Corythoichthys intestinalis]|uniref:calcium homeostasis modulator protein 6-like n=1 Tax=Corythoichthys intestinalis TaxID=161448 RepID=UPI0025A5246B|nr:calcium homeostasis modulator protein 6-like [Corythoichthys intestinalis]XP_061788927.1 calcium homeostasis modulator protein 6-like [Nerophis lumbriciformis]
MDKFNAVLKIANKQTNLGFGLVSLLTAGGEQIFSSVLFRCPCNELNFLYGMVFLLVPALALLLLAYILSKKMWKMMTGFCQDGTNICCWKRMLHFLKIIFQISTTALVAPSSWIAVALLNGNYFECAMTGVNVSYYSERLCGSANSLVECRKDVPTYPCGGGSSGNDREAVLLTLRAHSQILGWLLIAFVMLSNLLLTCLARCSSPVSYLQLKFWKVYSQEESNLMDSYTSIHAKELAERNIESFFKQTSPQHIITPSNKDWEKISTLYKFSTKDHYYSTLHKYVETGMMRMASFKSAESPSDNPAVLNFVDEGGMCL